MAASLPAPRPTRRTRIVCIGDTHNMTPKLPKGDVLVHAGDLTNQGSYSEVRSRRYRGCHATVHKVADLYHQIALQDYPMVGEGRL